MGERSLGLLLALAGAGLLLLGLGVAAGAFSWFGRLPGDLRWESGGARVYLPLASLLLLSLALNLLIYLIRRLG